jgi:REP-associated tyrosine transposase
VLPTRGFVAALCERRILSAVTDRRYRASDVSTARCYGRRRLHSENPISFGSVTNRLGRLDRIYVRAPIYFLTACTARRRPLLAKQDVHEAFIRFARQGTAHGVWIGAYVLMPDHLHAFVALDAERVNLSALMKSLKNVLSKKLRERGVAPPHWQKGFFDHVLRSQESAQEKWKYVRENPVRAGVLSMVPAVVDRRYRTSRTNANHPATAR